MNGDDYVEGMARSQARRRPGASRISDEHKAALAEGRKHGRAVRKYLEALASNSPRQRRGQDPTELAARLEAIDDELEHADPLRKLHLHQERLNLTSRLQAIESAAEFEAIEAAFIEVARAYGERKGISYDAWRECGVPVDVLRRAGIARSG